MQNEEHLKKSAEISALKAVSEDILFEGNLLARIIRKDCFASGYNFISMNDWLLQVGFNFYKEGQVCVPHEHFMRPISVENPIVSLELLYIVEGELRMTLFWKDKEVQKTKLSKGDAIFLVCGGHSLEMDKATQILEVKQGPYFSREQDKRTFVPKSPNDPSL